VGTASRAAVLGRIVFTLSNGGIQVGNKNMKNDKGRARIDVPANVDMDKVKKAHLKLARTEDENWIHPEELIQSTRRYQHLLRNMNQDQRLADRRAHLFLD
jgi:hypothetical protein